MLGKEKHYKEIQEHIADWYGLKLPIDDIKETMLYLEKNDPEFWKEEYRCESYTDTLPREDIINGIAEVFLKLSWPINMDSQETFDKFYKKLNEVAKERKWESVK